MARGPLVAKAGLVGVLAAFAFAPDGSAGVKWVTVALTASGPAPSTVTKSTVDSLEFLNNDSVAHTVNFPGWHCSLDVQPGATGACHNDGPHWMGSYPYIEDGTFRGKVQVRGLFRSVSLTAPTHSVTRGTPLELHGQLTFDNHMFPFCAAVFPLRVFARHEQGQPYSRIAWFPVRPAKANMRAGKRGCTYRWQLNVRPKVSTTYIAEVKAKVWDTWRQARSRPFTALIRP